MNSIDIGRWQKALHNNQGNPAYRLIAQLIADDINSGRLQPREKLPTLRSLADQLELNYTTVARAFKEARRRGLIDSKTGSGSYVRGRASALPLSVSRSAEMNLNLPIEPQHAQLLERLQAGAASIFTRRDSYSMLRYQDFGGSDQDKQAGLNWLSRRIGADNMSQVLVCPGIHSVLLALLSQCAANGGVICVGNLVYPGIKAIAAQLGVTLQSIPTDNSGPMVRPFEELCKTDSVNALYINPTLHNPTTVTVPTRRREALVDIAMRYSVPIIEDDAYTMLTQKEVVPFVTLAPELTYYVTGLSKCFGAGLRIAYLYMPSARIAQRLAGSLRALAVMTNPITTALATRWVMDGTADLMVREIRREARARQQLAQTHLGELKVDADPDGFHLWIHLPKDTCWNPSELAVNLRQRRVGAVASAAFATDNAPPQAIRLCLGGPSTRQDCQQAMHLLTDLLEQPSALSSMAL